MIMMIRSPRIKRSGKVKDQDGLQATQENMMQMMLENGMVDQL